MRSWRWRGLAVCGGLLLAARTARADGAFPDSENVMTPAALPHEIALATNFGLVLSVDDGQTWTWTCEQTQNSYGSLYQIGAQPLNRLYAVAAVGLVFSDNSSCTWSVAGGAIAGASVLDAFPDPSNPNRMMAIVARAGDDGGTTFQVYESTDAGATFATLRYTAADGDHLTGVEIARSAPSTVYLTITSGTSYLPKLARSTDGGATWQVQDLSASLGAGTTSLRLIAVDPENPQRVFMRVSDTAGEQVAVTNDGGATVSTPLVFPAGIVSAFARLANGDLVIAGVVGVDPVAYVSTDDGATFEPLPTPPHLRALSARGATLYGVADNANDGYAIGTSLDEGMTWQPLMSYDQIQAIQTCVAMQCQTDCLSRADLGQWPPEFCAATPMPAPIDGGTAPSSDGAASAQDSHDAASATGGAASGGCHCALGGTATTASSPSRDWRASGVALALGLGVVRRRRRRTGQHRPGPSPVGRSSRVLRF